MRDPDIRNIDIHERQLQTQRQELLSKISQMNLHDADLEHWLWMKQNFEELKALRKLLRNG